MKCPVMLMEWRSKPDTKSFEPKECLQEGCGWWSDHMGRCSVTAFVQLLIALGNVIGKIHDELKLDRVTYRCRDCGLSIEATPGDARELPHNWTRPEQVDGKLIMLCDRCSKK